MPNYVKRREYETVALTKKCSAFLQNKLLSKLKDFGNFTITCNIREYYCGKALYDLGASINLMPKSIFKLLGIAYPEGKIKGILVRVDKFIFPADFIVLDFEADKEVPIILGRPFLATGRTLIDVQKGELT
ncbi:Retrovirus-related Pol polyprotein from transposon opus [Gossypium australe]|uniref:Retrovirus-related Pol polyprotein from transposon opus n=1 Tax=Gossypium australe TaxID=47621 RepID=A0A5B6X2T6_9ROSI|nr:Retrovirus-related Pol polyprotein from transposon opus [Gossypium australe]